MKPVVDRLAQQYEGDVGFMVYDNLSADQRAAAFATEHGVRAVPTMVLVSAGGQELERWVGAVPAERLSASLDAAH